jgi:hypothetical protein
MALPSMSLAVGILYFSPFARSLSRDLLDRVAGLPRGFAQLWCMSRRASLSFPRMKSPFAAAWGVGCWLVFAGLVLAQTAAPPPAPVPVPLSPVIYAENPDVVQRFAVNAPMARSMLNRALLKLTSAPDVGTAWTRLGVTPEDVVGIKITTMGGPLLSSHWPLVQAICDGLQAAGLPTSHIIIWDKSGLNMQAAGYSPAEATDSHVGIASIFPGTGYDPDAVYKNNLVGSLIWGDSEFASVDPATDVESETQSAGGRGFDNTPANNTGDALSGGGFQTSTRSHYANLMTRICTKIINVPVLTDNSYVGMNGCLASLALGIVDNNRRFQGDPTYGDPAICEILNPDFVRHKVIIHILDSLVAEYAGGPVFNPIFTEPVGAIYVSRDPVAIDSLVLPRLERWRKYNHVDPIGSHANHIHDAANYHLGTDDRSRIQLIQVP